jgi:cyclophilin family peptidyl-prolyl cis-trans isomerase
MRWKAALAMVLLAGLVVGVLWYDSSVSGPLKDLDGRKGKIFPAFKADLAEEITLDRADPAKGKVVLANREGTWRMEQPVGCKANNFNVSGLTSAISDCEPERNTDVAKPAKGQKLDPAKYGLDKPAAEVTVKMKDSAKTVLRFTLGAKQGLYEGAYYLKSADQEAVYVVGKRLAEELLRDSDGYRDRKLFDMTAGDVDSLELDVGKGLISARREAEDQWRLTAPVPDRGSRTKLEALRDKLLDRDLDDFDRGAIDPAKQGFDKPSMRLVLSSQKAGKRQEVLVGKVVEGNPHLVYARRADLPFLYRVQKKNLDELQPTVNDLRDNYLETFPVDKLAGFTARDPAGAELILERDGESWRMTRPKEAPADRQAVEDMGSKLSSLEIKAFVEDAPKDLVRYGLEKPELALVLRLRVDPPAEEKKDEAKDAKKDEKKPEEKKAPEFKALGELLFGKICPAGTVAGAEASGRFRYAKRAADPGVFAVPAEAVDRLLGGALALRDRTVLKVANKDKILRLAVSRGELKYAAEKKDGKWMLTSPVGEEADSGASGRLVDRLADLTAEKVVADGVRGKAVAEYGLDKPSAALELVVETGADPKTHRALLGKASSAGGTYAMLADGEVIYELSRGTADDLSGELVRRELLDFDKTRAQKIVVTRKRGELVLARTGQGWSIEQPAPAAPADKDKVEALLAALAGLRAERIADYAPAALSKYGLVKPTAAVTVEVEGTKPAVLQVGDGLESGARRYVKVPERAPAFVVDKSVYERLEVPAEDLKEKKKQEKPPTTAAPGGGKTSEALPRVRIKTERGDIVAELLEDDAPNTVANFIQLAEGGKYDGLTFHRIIKGFMIQGGDPRGDGTGDFGYKFADEIAGRTNNRVATGTLCMANSGPDTNGSQFFIMTGPERPDLSLRHTVFGKVVEGLAVAEAISAEKSTGGQDSRALKPVKMLKVEVLNKRDHPYEVKKL